MAGMPTPIELARRKSVSLRFAGNVLYALPLVKDRRAQRQAASELLRASEGGW